MIVLVLSLKFVIVYRLEHIAAILVDYLNPVDVAQTPVNVDHCTEWLYTMYLLYNVFHTRT